MRCRGIVLSLSLGLGAAPLGGCATIAGTSVSPVTGGVDLIKRTLSRDQWYWVVPVFLGGAVAGPFVAIYNGVNYDVEVFHGFERYWFTFDRVFRPFELVGL